MLLRGHSCIPSIEKKSPIITRLFRNLWIFLQWIINSTMISIQLQTSLFEMPNSFSIIVGRTTERRRRITRYSRMKEGLLIAECQQVGEVFHAETEGYPGIFCKSFVLIAVL